MLLTWSFIGWLISINILIIWLVKIILYNKWMKKVENILANQMSCYNCVIEVKIRTFLLVVTLSLSSKYRFEYQYIVFVKVIFNFNYKSILFFHCKWYRNVVTTILWSCKKVNRIFFLYFEDWPLCTHFACDFPVVYLILTFCIVQYAVLITWCDSRTCP